MSGEVGANRERTTVGVGWGWRRPAHRSMERGQRSRSSNDERAGVALGQHGGGVGAAGGASKAPKQLRRSEKAIATPRCAGVGRGGDQSVGGDEGRRR